MLKEIPRISIVEDAVKRNLYQYKETNVEELIKILVSPLVEVEEAIQEVSLERRLSVAKGAQLDVIGRIVGISRFITSVAIIDEIFQVNGGEGYKNFQTFDGDVLENFYVSIKNVIQEENKVELDDDTYRRVIYTKIKTNHTHCTVNDIIEATQTLIGDAGTLVRVIEYYRPYYDMNAVGTEDFQVLEQSVYEDFQVDPTGSGDYQNLTVDVTKESDTPYLKIKTPISLENFKIVFDVFLDSTETDGVLLGSSVGINEGILYYEASSVTAKFNLTFSLGGKSITIPRALTRHLNHLVEVSRTGSNIKIKIDTTEVLNTPLNSSVWDWDLIGRSFSSPYQLKGIISNLKVYWQELKDTYLYYPMDNLSSTFSPYLMNKLPPPEQAIANLSVVQDHEILIENYNPDYWIPARKGYKVKIYKEIDTLTKSLIKENNILPKTIGVPVKYEDISGEF